MFSRGLLIIIVCLCLILLARFFFAYQTRHIYQSGEQVNWNLLLLSDIDSNSGSVQLTTFLPHSFPPERVIVRLPLDSHLHFGQRTHISGTLSKKVLSKNNVVYTIYSSEISPYHSITDYFLLPLYYIRRNILALFQMTLSDTDSSLLAGIVFGIKTSMPKAFSQQLQVTGVTHVIAASGMNVTMVAGFLIWLFGKYVPRKIAVGLSIFGLGLYAVFAGLQLSILRATIMGVCAFSAQLVGRQYHAIYILTITAFVILMISPQALFDVGFQLSFLSTLGIIFIQPLIAHKNLLSEDLATTIAAQVATVPVLVSSFGQYSLFSIIVNGLVLWTIPPLMILGSLGAFVGLLVPCLGKFFLLLAVPLVWFFEDVVGFFAAIPAVFTVSISSPFLIIGYYLVVISGVSFVYLRKKNKLMGSLSTG